MSGGTVFREDVAAAVRTALDPAHFDNTPDHRTVGDLLIDSWVDDVRVHGTRLALVESGLVPSDLRFPGDVPGQRGGWFRDAGGRVARVCRGWSAQTFWLTIVRTKAELAACLRIAELDKARYQRLEEINEALERLSANHHQAASRLRGAIRGACQFIRSTQEPGEVRLDDAARLGIAEGVDMILAAMASADVTFDTSRRAALIAERNALQARKADPEFGGFLRAVLAGDNAGAQVA